MTFYQYMNNILSVDGDADGALETEFELVGINSNSWYHC